MNAEACKGTARRNDAYSNVDELREFFLTNVLRTGKRLGSGTFGMVEELIVGGTLHAGKTPHASLLNSESAQQQYISGCRILSKLDHPNIVHFVGLYMFEDGAHPVLVSELLDDSLENVMSKYQGRIPLPLVLHVMKQSVQGLIYLHHQKPPVVHRNLTARNILINKATANAKIADIGDAFMTDTVKFRNALEHSPEILPYMAPEVLYNRPDQDRMLDIFSFGHLALTCIIQKCPLARELQTPTYYDQQSQQVKSRSEVQRRQTFIEMLYNKLTETHRLTKLILQCLNDNPGKRPKAIEVLKDLADVFVDNDPYHDEVNLVKLLNAADSHTHAVTSSAQSPSSYSEEYLEHRVKEIQNGAPAVLDIYRVCGILKRANNKDWRRHMFQITDGSLKYFRNKPNDASYGELGLLSVVCVKACPPRENPDSFFYFEVHYSDYEGSPWLLRAYTQDDRACWMEAIKPGSSAFFRPSATSDSDYEEVTFRNDDGAIYDEPDTCAVTLEHKTKAASSTTKLESNSAENMQANKDSPYEFGDFNSAPLHPNNDDAKLLTVNQQLTESDLSPNEVQLWLLLEMQKMVLQKMQDMPAFDLRSRPDIKARAATLPHGVFPPDYHLQAQSNDTSSDEETVERALLSTTLPTSQLLFNQAGKSRARASTDLSFHAANDLDMDNARSVTSSSSTKNPTKGVGQKEHPETFPQKLKPQRVSQEDVISSLKHISPQCISHLVAEESVYVIGRRPDWTKAKTQSSLPDLPLIKLHQSGFWLPRSCLRDLEELGQGQYGKLYKGIYRKPDGPEHNVAIKTLKQCESEKDKDDFLTEMKLMSNLIHPNIVYLFGLVQQDEPWLVLEYLPHGDLKTFLMNHKRPVTKLIKYMLDVATGMHYISEKGLVHRDLAARNIMLGHEEICKVGDFGLLRQLPEDSSKYMASSQVALPIRWMAPESLSRKEFSPATDVWSFGIVMWEMYYPKDMPYADMSNVEVATNVSHGKRLSIPQAYPHSVVEIMKACWQDIPSQRPSFMLCACLLTSAVYGGTAE